MCGPVLTTRLGPTLWPRGLWTQLHLIHDITRPALDPYCSSHQGSLLSSPCPGRSPQVVGFLRTKVGYERAEAQGTSRKGMAAQAGT